MAWHCLQQAVWQDSGINTLEMKCIIESYNPAANARKPLPRQAAGTIDDISLEKVEKTMSVIKRRDLNFHFENVEEFLIKNGLLFEDNRISNGCFLMFSKEENLYTTIQMGQFASDIIIKDDVVNSDDILTQIDEVMVFIRKHINKELIITDTQIENIQRWQYPLDALREIVLNAILCKPLHKSRYVK